jgi:ABC-type branched-subunit amino acid transport system permease subunit
MYLGAMRSGASLVLYGLLLIVVIVVRPRGLISLFARTKEKPLPKELHAN